MPPSVSREQRGPVPQDAHRPLCPAHPGERGQRREGGLDQRPPLPGRVLPVAVCTHLGLVAHEQDGQEEDTELQEWNCECVPLPAACLFRPADVRFCCGNGGIASLLAHTLSPDGQGSVPAGLPARCFYSFGTKKVPQEQKYNSKGGTCILKLCAFTL